MDLLTGHACVQIPKENQGPVYYILPSSYWACVCACADCEGEPGPSCVEAAMIVYTYSSWACVCARLSMCRFRRSSKTLSWLSLWRTLFSYPAAVISWTGRRCGSCAWACACACVCVCVSVCVRVFSYSAAVTSWTGRRCGSCACVCVCVRNKTGFRAEWRKRKGAAVKNRRIRVRAVWS